LPAHWKEFFLANECEEEKKTAYGQYLKRRIRPAMEALIREENVGKMELLENSGWFGAEELENFDLYCQKRAKVGEPGVADEVKGSEIRI